MIKLLKEQLRNEEMFAILGDEIEFMKVEITHKNMRSTSSSK